MAPLSCAASSGGAFDAPAFVSGLEEVALVGETIEQRCGHVQTAENVWPFPKEDVGGDENRGAFIKTADALKQQSVAGLDEWQQSSSSRHMRSGI